MPRRKIIVAGVEYATVADAAREYGLKPTLISNRLRKDWSIERAFGIDTKKPPIRRNEIIVGGITYPSIAEAARVHGKKIATIKYRLDGGYSPDEAFDLDPDSKIEHTKKITLEGVEYTSIAEATHCYEIDYALVRDRLSKGWKPERAFEIDTTKPPVQGKAVDLEGVQYPSIAEAARCYGFHPATINSRLSNGWSLERAFEIDPDMKIRRPKEITARGVKYPSISEAARTHRLKEGVVSKRLRHGWSIEEALGLSVREILNAGKPLVVDGVEYESINAAAEKFGVEKTKFRYRLKIGLTPEQAAELEPFPDNFIGLKKIEVDGVTYPSISEVARAHDLQPDLVEQRLLRKWSIKQALNKEPPPESAAANPVELEGIRFRSLNYACEEYGIPYHRVEGRMRLGWSLEQAFDIDSPPEGASLPKPITLQGIEYPSRADAVRAYNIPYSVVKGRMVDLNWTPEQAFGIEPPPENPWADTRDRGGIIYNITNTQNGLMYFGQTSKRPSKRWYDHQLAATSGPQTKLQRAMSEIGIKNFVFEVIDEAVTGPELDQLEAEYIFYFDTAANGYNSYQPPLNVTEWRTSGLTHSVLRTRLEASDETVRDTHRQLKNTKSRVKYEKLAPADKVAVRGHFLDYECAEKFVHGLCLRNYAEWKAWLAGEMPGLPPRPDNIPTNPNYTYKNQGWVRLGKWLGTGTIATFERQYWPFEKARNWVRKLELKSTRDWTKYIKSHRPDLPTLPDEIPRAPEKKYKNEGWSGYGDWLGTGRISNRYASYQTYDNALKFVHALNLSNYRDWNSYCKGGMKWLPAKPADIPATPNGIYKDAGWVSWSHWLGTSKSALLTPGR